MYGRDKARRHKRDVRHMYCRIKGKPCRFVSLYAKDKHCGIQTGHFNETLIDNMTACPFDGKVRRGQK